MQQSYLTGYLETELIKLFHLAVHTSTRNGLCTQHKYLKVTCQTQIMFFVSSEREWGKWWHLARNSKYSRNFHISYIMVSRRYIVNGVEKNNNATLCVTLVYIRWINQACMQCRQYTFTIDIINAVSQSKISIKGESLFHTRVIERNNLVIKTGYFKK